MGKFWQDLLPHQPANISWENKSIDVAIKGCFYNYDITACIRSSLLFFLGFCSLVFCIIRITKLHLVHHPQIHQYLIFYFASLEVILLTVKWFAISDLYQLEFVAYFLKMIQFVLLCQYHWSLVSRIRHQQKLITWVIIPLLAVLLSLFSFITALGILSRFPAWAECLAPHWLLLSFVEFLGIQLYVVAGFYITKKINSISAMDSFKWEQKKDLWSVILAYTFSSAITLAYYVTLRAMGSVEIGCSGIFDHVQDIYSPIYATFMVIKYLLPIWVMLVIFYPTQGCLSSEDERLLGWSGDGSTTSVFSPGTRFFDSYRQLILPVQNAMYSEPPLLRRTASSPAIFAQPEPEPVTENNPILPSSQVAYIGYGAMDYQHSQPETAVFQHGRTRSRHDSGMPPMTKKGKNFKVPVSLNHCSDEMESLTQSSGERV